MGPHPAESDAVDSFRSEEPLFELFCGRCRAIAEENDSGRKGLAWRRNIDAHGLRGRSVHEERSMAKRMHSEAAELWSPRKAYCYDLSSEKNTRERRCLQTEKNAAAEMAVARGIAMDYRRGRASRGGSTGLFPEWS